MEFRPECPEMGLLWAEEVLQPFLRTVRDHVAHKRYAKPTKKEIKSIKLELPLTFGLLVGAEYGALNEMPPATELDPFVFDMEDDETASAPIAKQSTLKCPTAIAHPKDKNVQLAMSARQAAQAEQNIRYKELSEVPEERFGLLTVASIAKLAAALLYNDLHLLLHERGSPQTKAAILEWIFAEKWGYRVYANGYDTLPMNLIPFTAQFCCEMEDIDIDELRAAISGLVELAVKRDAVEVIADSQTPNHTLQPPMSQLTMADTRVQ